ncbi:hypothetical protein J5N97_013495 [Dioscorea zingiberensis]|uniref:Uncharacterized protein n=1 Tax=Dioscorea zingiberensis TaxID=325984 RepID=A0A9D5CQN6_9LILI|nr:hypothetical protein J5N97_013495 [Dioscorea zingiberensis]
MSTSLDNVDGTQPGSISSGHKRKGTPNKRWTPDMDSVLIPCLVEMVKAGLKGHPKAKDYLNKPIPLFDELRMVCGDNHATGEWSIFHPFGVSDPISETQPEGLDNMESDPLNDNEQQEQPRSSTSNRNSRPPWALRTSNEDVIITDIAQGIGQITGSLKELKKKNWKEKLTDALDTLQGYSIQDMSLLYVTLRDDRRLAEDFYMRTQSLCEFFVNEFLADRRASRPSENGIVWTA